MTLANAHKYDHIGRPDITRQAAEPRAAKGTLRQMAWSTPIS